MNLKDKITVRGVSYEVVGKIGAGGQGAVWKVKSAADNRTYALKIIDEKDVNRRSNKVANIQRLVNEKVDKKLEEAVAKGAVTGINHACPISYYVDPVTHETGYVMEFEEGKTLNKLLIDGSIDRMSVTEKLRLLKKIAASIAVLHSLGYCYTDINWGNFMWNEQTDMLSVIDCENMACTADILSGRCSFLIGTGFFVAPEVAFGKAKAGYNSDKYALASLIFRVLTNNVLQSAYHGMAMYSAVPACQNMLEVADMDDDGDIDPKWRKFVFDKNDRSNGLDNLCKNSKNPENIAFRRQVESVMAIWNNLDEELKRLFYQAFDDPFAKDKRPMPSTWVRVIDGILATPPAVVVKSVPAPAAAVKASNAQQTKTKTAKTNVNDKYPAFKPAGGERQQAAAQAPALPEKPYLISTLNKVTAITDDDFLIDGEKLGLKQKTIGQLRKTENGYEFVSRLLSAVEVFDESGNFKCKLSKGQSAPVLSGYGVKPVVSTVSIKIIF